MKAALSGKSSKKVIRCANMQDFKCGGILLNGANMKKARRNKPLPRALVCLQGAQHNLAPALLPSPRMLAAGDSILKAALRASLTSGGATKILEKAIACTDLQSLADVEVVADGANTEKMGMLLAPPLAQSRARERTPKE